MVTYTGIGSRETPESVLRVMRWLGYQLAGQEWVLRSGAAAGADHAFERGVLYHTHQYSGFNADKMRIYLPSERFSTKERVVMANPMEGYHNASRFPNWLRAQEIAKMIHPAWDRVLKNPWAVALHTRNCYQVLGDNLNTPSDVVIYWAQATPQGNIKGGTRTAVLLAHLHKIPTFNLASQEEYNALLDWVA